MPTVSFSDGLAISGLILTVVLVVLDKSGKLKGPLLLALFAVAVSLAIPLLFSIRWIADAPPGPSAFARRALAISLLGVIWAGSCVWITNSDAWAAAAIPTDTKNGLEVTSIVPGQLIPGQPFDVTINMRNTSGRVIRIRNLAFAQTRSVPQSREEELANESEVWSQVSQGLEAMGQDRVIPTMGGGETNQIIESNPISLPEYRDIMRGSHAVYFALVTRNSVTRENLIELCFFVGNRGIVHFCPTYNKP